MWHGCLLLPVTSQAVCWPLHFWCWQAKLELWQPACVCMCAQTHSHTGFKGTSSKKKKSFQMTKHRLLDECLLLIVFVVSPSLFHMSIIVSVFIFHSLSFFFFVLIFGSFTLYLRSISKYFLSPAVFFSFWLTFLKIHSSLSISSFCLFCSFFVSFLFPVLCSSY